METIEINKINRGLSMENKEVDYKDYEKIIFAIMSNMNIHQYHSMYKDALQAGYCGLLKAIDTYNPDHIQKAKLSTHAYWQIKKSIQTEIAKMSKVIQTKCLHTLKHNEIYSLDSQYIAENHGVIRKDLDALLRDSNTPLNELCHSEEADIHKDKFTKLTDIYCKRFNVKDKNVIVCLFENDYYREHPNYEQKRQYLLDNYSKEVKNLSDELKDLRLQGYFKFLVQRRLKTIAKKNRIKYE